MYPKDELLAKPYHITPYTLKKAKKLGLVVKPSTNPKKKLDVFQDGERIAQVGAIGYSDYPSYIISHGKEYAEKRRELYHKRHTKDSLGEYLARELLW
jgi:hypothetical protein